MLTVFTVTMPVPAAVAVNCCAVIPPLTVIFPPPAADSPIPFDEFKVLPNKILFPEFIVRLPVPPKFTAPV